MKSIFFHLKKSLLIENFKTHRFQFKNLSINSANNESSSKSEIIQKLQKKVEQIELKDETREDNITKSKNTIIKSNQRRKLINKSRYINFSKLPDSVLPRVALIGRPNVGKSALFNKLSKTPKAIVYDTPGVTRDRLFVRCYWGSREFLLIDTGGIPDKTTINDLEKKSQIFDSVIINEMALNDVNKDDIPEGIEKQLVSSLLESECIVFVADGKEGLANGDVEILTWMRKFLSEKHIFLAVNKCDDLRCADVKLSTFWEMGLEPIPVSAMTGSGTGDLLDKIIKVLPKFRIGANLNKNEEEEEETIVTIIGRPNTGKSSMLNALIGDDRSIVSKIPGTTRDSIDCTTELHGGHLVRLVDTAGIRRRMAVTGSKDKVEKLMVKSALRSIRRCNVVILMIDCVEGITNQDLKIVKLASDEGKAIVLIANKFDLLNKKDWNKEKLEAILKLRLRESEWAQIVITSLKRDPVTGNYIGEDIKSEFRKLPVFKNISRAILDADQNHSKRINTATLNSIVQDAVHFKQPPSGKGGRHGKIYYATQTSVRPPTFVMFVNDEALINDDYKKYLEKQLRDTIDFSGTTIKVLFKGKPPRPDKIYNNDKNIKMLQYNKM